jgi:hypothetical protein
MNFRKISFSKILIAVLLFASFSENLHAQSGTASISGTIFDQNKQTISGANVTLTDAAKGFSRATAADENGAFIFPSIQTGIYRLTIEMNGFKRFVQTGIRAVVDTPTEISAVLEVGDISETVTVKSESPLNTQDASIGNPFNSDQVIQLPVEAREVLNLLTLQPGVTRFGYVAGGRSDQANITLDGIDVNNPIFNQISSPNLRLNAEAIEEFRVTTTNANSSQGRSAGAQISLVTKSGTNQFRGAIFLTGRRTAWTANDFFNNRANVTRPKLDRNVFGGAIGGAILKNRLFFFYSYEGERTTRGETVVRVVPLENLGRGIVRFQTTNGQIVSLDCSQITTIFPNTNGCNPHALAVFADAAARYRANSFEVGDGLNTGGFRFNGVNKIKNNSHVLRLDFNLSGKQQAFFRANYINDLETQAPQFPDTPAPTNWTHPTGFVVGHSRAISAKLFNNFRFGTTRMASSNVGDSSGNAISFAGVYSPRRSGRGNSAIDSVRTLTDDVSWIWRNHTFQFGTNVRLTRSQLHSFARAYDSATADAASFANGAANAISNPINNYLQNTFGYQIAEENIASVQNAVTAVIGRYSTYTASFTFLRDGALQPVGMPRDRDFRSEGYDFYAQDIWKISPNLTATVGLRYELNRPIYEANGYEVKPTIGLSDYFELRANGAATGVPYNQPIVLDFSGPANGRTTLYPWDKNNFQPRLALAWSPNFGRFFGKNNESVMRGGFAVTNDYFTVFNMARFDNQNTLGFASRSQIQNQSAANSPLFTGFNQNIRNLPGIALPVGNLTFPRQAAIQNSPNFPAANELSFDENIIAPIHYNWNLTFERALPKGVIVSISYLGRRGRNLLQPRDAAAIANFVDTQSGTDWNTAATQLEILRQRGMPVSNIAQIPYFANLFPSNLAASVGCPAALNQTQAVYALVSSGCSATLDWVRAQRRLSLLSSRFPRQHIFSQPQYGSYRALSSIGKSDYQGLAFSIRQRLGTRLTFDFNYTFSKSADDGSGLQSALADTSSTVINAFRPEDMYAASDFDMRHIVNANAIFKLPVGRGEISFGKAGKFTDFFIGGWQLAGIFRYNSGLPISAPNDNRLATSGNVNIKSYATRAADIQTCPTRGGSLFGCNTLEAYRSFRNAYPGETGERNVFRLPSFYAIDLGFGKTFDLPWENHKFQFRWEIFNLTNTQKMGSVSNYIVGLDPQTASQTPVNFANFTAVQGSPRSMQFILRCSF